MSHRNRGGGSPPLIDEQGPSGLQDQPKKRPDPERPTINLSDDSKSETEPVPSNQQAGAEHTQKDNEEDDFAALGLLTQYIGPLKTNPRKPSSKTSEDRRILNLTEQLKGGLYRTHRRPRQGHLALRVPEKSHHEGKNPNRT